MKQILTIMLLLSCVLSAGCKSTEDIGSTGAVDLTGHYTYMILKNSDAIGTILCRFDIDTGIVTPICTDPLCQHHKMEGFLFASVSRCFVVNNKIIIPNYTVYDPYTNTQCWQVIGYDIPSDRYEVWYQYDKSYTAMDTYETIIGDYFYCQCTGEFEGEDGEKVYDTTVTYRISLIDGQCEILDDIKYLPGAVYKERYYYGGNQGNRMIFSTDLHGKDRQEYNIGFLVGEAHYERIDDGIIVGRGFGMDNNKLCQINIETNEIIESDLGMYIYDMCVGDNYIYLLCDEPEPALMGYDVKHSKDVYNRTGGKVYRMKLGSSDCELYKDFGADYSFFTSMEMVDRRIVLDYGAIVQDSYWSVDTWNEKGGGKVVIDTATDEVTLFERTWNLPTSINVNVH